MATIQIRNLPEDTVRTLKVRAAKNGQSLQEYMRSHLIDQASKPTVEELVEMLERRHRADVPDLPLEETFRGIDETWE